MTPAGLSCRDLIDFLDRYLDGELAGGERERFEAHLRICPACVDYLHGYREAVRLAADAWQDDAPPPPEVPAKLVEAILDARRTGAGGA